MEPPSPASNLRWMEEIGRELLYSIHLVALPAKNLKLVMVISGYRQPRQYNLEPGIVGVGGENFGISMFHSMHCLVRPFFKPQYHHYFHSM